MRQATLQRVIRDEKGIFGRLTLFNFSLFSGELPWKENQSNVSCIPTGKYLVRMSYSPRFRRPTYELTNVPNRFSIRIHPANLPIPQLNGCIALGEHLGTIDGQRAVLMSQPAVRRFEAGLNRRPFILTII